MDRDTVVRLAKEADSGFDGAPDADGTMPDSLVGMTAVMRFANLIANETLERAAGVVKGEWALSKTGKGIAAAIRALKE